MLYLGNGLRQVEVGDQTVYLFSDFSDPLQFYYMPNFPHIAKMPDGSPGIHLLVYRQDLSEIGDDEEDAVAFLSLDVDVSWDSEVIDKAARKIQAQDELAELPRLTPIFFREGSVKLMLLDAVTPDETAEPDEGAKPTPFVQSILGGSSPSLYGDNRAIFQATLTKKGAAALTGAMDKVLPIGVVYSLTFAALQPAFNIKASVNWDKVYEHFSEKTGFDIWFVDIEIEKIMDELVESKVIQIEVTVEGVGGDAMDSVRDDALKTIKSLIFEKFFEATLDRETAAGGGTLNDIAGALHDVATPFGYSYSRKEVTVDELRTIDIDFSARKATERKIYPQAHMHAMIKGAEVTREQLVTIVDGGADAVWKTLGFQVMAAAAWKADGIAGITVDIEYDEQESGATHSWSTFLTEAKASDTHREWMDRSSGNKFRYKYEVVFTDEGVRGPRPKVDSGGWTEHEGTVLVIHPRQLYDSQVLEVGAVPGFDFTRWPAVQAVMRYRTLDAETRTDPNTGAEVEVGEPSFVHMVDGVLKKEAPSFSTRFRTDAGVPASREIRLTYVGAEGERVEQPWVPMQQAQWIVEDPHSEKLTIRAIVAGDRRNIANLIVDLEYNDEENGISHSGTLTFDPENINKPQMVTFALADPSKRRYRYRMTLVTMTGDFVQTGWIGTDAPTLPVGEVYVRRLNVEVVVAGELGPGVEAVEVKLVYDNPDSGQHEERTFKLGANGRAEWMVQLQDASRRDYEVTTTWFKEDGFNPTKGPEASTESLLVIPGTPEEG